jgi:superfamily II DNA or RNA helicase
MSLFDYQESHVDALHKAINEPCLTAIDASDTGTGKTYTAAALAARSKWRVAVVCPKAVLISWHRVLTQFNVEIMGISNYELFKGGQWYLPNDSKLGDISETCPYMIRPLDMRN